VNSPWLSRRRGTVAKLPQALLGEHGGVKPSRVRARLGDATTWRTSPERYSPVTRGVSPAPEPSATRSAARRIDTGSPEHTLKTSQRPDGASTAACSAATLAAATS
jgi:hypothetical protein